MSSPRRPTSLAVVFGATIFAGAALLFSIQPLVGKLLLPKLGGTPSVWNTVMVFFQAMLLAGYAYAHFSFRKLGWPRQAWLHAALLGLAAWCLPFRLESGMDSTLPPAWWVLLNLLQTIGLPVFALAATAPLLQTWFAGSNDPSAKDPYFLYAASNLGSFGALFGYPLLIEPQLRLQAQTQFWAFGYWGLAALMVGCAVLAGRHRRAEAPSEAPEGRRAAEPPTRGQVWSWIGLSFIPSSLMLGVTNYITTDVASVPLLWVIPLGAYLFTFVIAFGNYPAWLDGVSSRAIPILALAVVFPLIVQATEPVWVLLLLHLLFFLFATLKIHLKLSQSRPPAEHLTRFYLYLSVGGVLGGVFNALLAPVLFNSVVEYPLMILVATLVAFPSRGTPGRTARLAPITGGALVILTMMAAAAAISRASATNVGIGNLIAGLVLLGSYLLLRTPVRYTLAIATLLVGVGLFRQWRSPVLERERNFFGVLRVVSDGPTLRRLYHGTTIHGVQSTRPERQCEPLSYYHREGPVGEIAKLHQQAQTGPEVGLIGLGAGAIIAYSQPGERWTLFEIDPAVATIAQDRRYFTYLGECARAPFRIEIGDARLKLDAIPDDTFGLLYVDAFSSDVIPMHLLTLEATRLYRRKLSANGFLAFHISSRNFDLEPLVANLGRSVALRCFASMRSELSNEALGEGGLEANWIVLVPEGLAPVLLEDKAWREIRPGPDAPLWTDDFSSLLGVLKL